MYHLSVIALDIARERGLEADRHRRAVLAAPAQPARRILPATKHGASVRGREPRVRGGRPSP